jgi:response regulator RpfG family c-di-GMP phosphodiesterase
MTAERPFRAAVSESDARQHLANLARIEFDPSVVKTYLDIS